MARRLYFATTEADNGEPIANGTWSANAGAGSTLKMNRAKTNTTIGEVNTTSTAGQTKWLRAFVSEPLAAQTFGGTFKCQILTKEGASNDEVRLRMELYVVSGSTFALRGSLLTGPTNYGFSTEPDTTATNHSFADGDTVASLAVNDGDRVVLKLGFTDVTGTSPNLRIRVGDPTAGSDLPEDETTTTDLRPWCEFSQDILFQDEVVSPSVVASTSTKPSPTITSDRVSPSVIASTSTKPSPAINASMDVGALASTSTKPSPSIGASADAGALGSTSSVPSPSIGATLDAGALASASTEPSPAIGATADVGALATTSAVQSPAIEATLDAGALNTSSPVASPSLDGLVSPDALAATSSTLAPALTGHVEPSVVSSSSSIGAPSVLVYVSPDTLSTSSAVASPVVTSTTVSPAALATTATVLQPTVFVRGDHATIPARIPGSVSVATGAPAGSTTFSVAVSGAATIPTE